LLNTGNGFDSMAQSYAFGDTYLLSANMVNSYRLAVNRVAQRRVASLFFNAPDLGIKAYGPEGLISVSVTSGFSIGSNESPNRTTSYTASNDLSLIRGTHQFGFGVIIAHWRNNLSVFGGGLPGQYQFNGQTTGLGLADFLMGNLSQLRQVYPGNSTQMSQWYAGVYMADAWRATPRLTVNYGARWEPAFPQVIRHGVAANFSEQRYAAGIKSSVFSNAPTGFHYPGDPGFPGTDCRSNGICKATGIYTQWGNVSPRLGLAWDPYGDGRMSIRSSYGMAYDMLTGGFYNNFVSAPWTQSVTITSPAGGFDDPWSTYPGGNPFPTPPPSRDVAFLPFGSYFAIPYDNPTTTRHSWNLSIQRQVANDWLASATYMGSHGVNLWISKAVNPAIYFPGNFDANRTCTQNGLVLTGGNPGTACSTTGNINARRRLILQYPNVGGTTISFIDEPRTGGTQRYNGLLLSIQRRAADGLNVGANYTWSHCYGDGSKATQIGLPGNTGLDPNNRAYDRGNCEGDRRHIFNMTAVAETPQFASPALRALASGWRLSGIYKRTSGNWLTIQSGQDRQLSGVSGQRAQQILENPYGDRSSLTRYLNPAAFTQPAIGTLGNLRPRNVEGPANWNFDISLSRGFQIRENQRLEARIETYNVTNSLRPGDPNTTITSSIFGQINSSGDPRIMQFALKYIF
jgi:hypothetical protein